MGFWSRLGALFGFSQRKLPAKKNAEVRENSQGCARCSKRGSKRGRDSDIADLEAPRKVPRRGQCVGRVKRLLLDTTPPFGFIAPEAGGVDLFFNERLLGDGMTWNEFVATVGQYDHGTAPVLFVPSQGRDGRTQAKGVVALNQPRFKELDADGDGQVSLTEVERFLNAHPELRCELKHEMYMREGEEHSKLRGALFDRHMAAENKIYARYDEEKAKERSLRQQADQLWASSQELWNRGEKGRAKTQQAQLKETNIQAKVHQENAQKLKQNAVDLNWKNNEEMFEYVQEEEHKDRVRDGSWIDLHGLNVDFAVEKTLEVLTRAKAKGISSVEVISGAGLHSGEHGPVLKQKILDVLQHPPAGLSGLSFAEDTHGSFTVSFKRRKLWHR